MDEKQELLYLQQLVLDASTWRLSEGDDRDCIRLEVQDRLRRLAGQETVDQDGFAQSEPSQQTPKQKSSKAAWEAIRRRVRIGDKYAWVLKEHTEEVPRKNSPNRTRWALKPEFEELYKEKEAT